MNKNLFNFENLMDPEGTPSDEFNDWLNHTSKFYLKLSDTQRNEVLDSLISISGPFQLVYLTETLPSLLFRDFVSYLPSELLVEILKYLDGQDLLSCCQVSRCWTERIECLVDLWSFKVKDLGVVLPPTVTPIVTPIVTPTVTPIVTLFEDSTAETDANSHHDCCGSDGDVLPSLGKLQKRGKLYKNLYVSALKLIRGLKSGSSLTVIPCFITTGSRRVNSLMFHENYMFIGSDNQVQIRSVPEGKLISCISTHSVCDMIVMHSTIYTASFNANVESWDVDTGAGKHIFCGHTSAVLSVDVSEDESYVLTGSVDMTAKLWNQRGGDVELLITLSNLHHDWVFKVKFISCENDLINFITCDSASIHISQFNVCSLQISSKGIHADRGKEFISVSFQHNSPSMLFTSLWSEIKSISEFLTLRIIENRLERHDQWHISERIKAHILAVGLRFMLVMCSISRKDFFLLDLQKKVCLARISTPDCLLTRNKSTVTVCDTSWLDGFNLELLQPGVPLFAACVDRHSVMLGLWNTHLKDCVPEN